MGHIELRDLRDDDLDAVFEMMRHPEAVEMAAFTAAKPDDRSTFDAWIARVRADPHTVAFVVVEDDTFVGTAGLFTTDGDREVTYWIARDAWGRGVATETLGILISREPERPLFARVAAHNAASLAVLKRAGFTELSRNEEFAPGAGREIEEVVMVLMPTLD